MYVCKYIYIISKFWDSVKYPSGVAAFGPVLAGVFALFGQETSDVAEIDKPGTEEAGKVLLVFLVIFLGRLFFQVRTSQEETTTGYGHRSGHISRKYKVL